MKKQCSQCMKIKDCMQGTLIGKEESIDVWLCRECRSGAKKEPKDHKEAMEYASCVDTQSHLKKCGKCRGELKQEYKEKVKEIIQPCLNRCKQPNGLLYCDNCGLGEEDLKILTNL